MGPRAGLDGCVKSRPNPGFDPRTVQPVASRYTVYAIPAHIQRKHVCIYSYVYIGFKTFFYVVRHLDSIASYHPTGLHLGFFRSWPSLFLPFSFSSVFLVVSFVSASTSMLFWAVFLLPFFEQQRKQTNTKL